MIRRFVAIVGHDKRAISFDQRMVTLRGGGGEEEESLRVGTGAKLRGISALRSGDAIPRNVTKVDSS